MSIQMFDREETTEERMDEGHVSSQPLNDWIVEQKGVAAGRAFFGEFWLEGEMAMLFANAGQGKSVLAMEIAEAIAHGKPVGPLSMTAGKRKVLYVDLEMNVRQVTMRYTADGDGGGTLKKRHRFPADLRRVELDADRLLSGNSPEQTAGLFGQRIESEVKQHGATVLVIDSLTALKRSYYGSNELLPILRTLKRLARNHELSILVLADAPVAERSQSLTLSGLGGLKAAADAADSVLAIGASRHDPCGRYVKQLFSRSTPIVFSALHVPLFLLKKIDGNFLRIHF